MSRPSARPASAGDCVWVASKEESKLHLAPRDEADAGEDSLAGCCMHRVRGVIGTWVGRPPNIHGYVLCEPCCVAAKIFLVLSGPDVSLDEALSTALDSYRPGQHSMDRPTAVIPPVVEAEVTDRLPALRVIDVEKWPASDPDVGRRSGIGVPGSRYLPGTAVKLTGHLAQSYRPRHALELRAEVA